MTKRLFTRKYLLAITIITLWFCLSASACRFNVRDVGFIDLGDSPYYCYIYIDDSISKQDAEELKQIAHNTFAYSNLKYEIINITDQKDHPKTDQPKSLPAAVLISPDGRSLEVPFIQPFQQTALSTLNDIANSPMREKILQHVISSYAVILLIEGSEPEENQNAATLANYVIEDIAARMARLPKAIQQKPVLLTLPQKDFAREEILLWSLALDAEEITRPYMAVLYGRCKMMGHVLNSMQINFSNLAELLDIIGADCECDLDRRWMHGNMLPVQWDKTIQNQIAQALGFDPENPVVKMEVSQIVGLNLPEDELYDSSTAQYQELVVIFDKPPQAQQIPPPQKAAPDTDVSPSTKSTSILWYLLAGLAVVILVAGIIIIYRSGRSNR